VGKKVVAFFFPLPFLFLASVPVWMASATPGLDSLGDCHYLITFPSLTLQTASLCATHYPAIHSSREEIVNVSGAGDRYTAQYFAFSS